MNSEGRFLTDLQQYVPLDENKIEDLLKASSTIQPIIRELFEKYKHDKRLWNLFGQSNYEILSKIQWNIFRRAINLGEESKESSTRKALKMIKEGKIRDFNTLREEGKFTDLDFNNVDLRGANLESANMRGSNLRNADLESAKLYYTKFPTADLSQANLSSANLLETNFFRANLSGANLSHVNANLGSDDYVTYDAIFDVNLSESNLTKDDLSGAKLPYAVIINPQYYTGLIVDNETDFSNAVTDNERFITYIKDHTANVPKMVKNKVELGDVLRERDFDERTIRVLLGISRLP